MLVAVDSVCSSMSVGRVYVVNGNRCCGSSTCRRFSQHWLVICTVAYS